MQKRRLGACSKGKSQCHLPPFKSLWPVFHLPPKKSLPIVQSEWVRPPAPPPLGHIRKPPPSPAQPSSYEYGCKQANVLFFPTHIVAHCHANPPSSLQVTNGRKRGGRGGSNNCHYRRGGGRKNVLLLFPLRHFRSEQEVTNERPGAKPNPQNCATNTRRLGLKIRHFCHNKYLFFFRTLIRYTNKTDKNH